jgi:uncharacterized repeat protein (TIGR03803 family)
MLGALIPGASGRTSSPEIPTENTLRSGDEMKKTQRNRGWAAVMITAILMMLTTAVALSAQSSVKFTPLFDFNGADGELPSTSLTVGTDGNLYGTTPVGGAFYGSVFKMSTTGTEAVLYSFCAQIKCSDGSVPSSSLVPDTDGNFYGTTFEGGSHGYGTVFRITSDGAFTTVYNFCSNAPDFCLDGADPGAGVIEGADGSFYGTTAVGGAYGYGTVFKLTSQGHMTRLYSFCSLPECTDGKGPSSPLIEASDGNFYGTTSEGGTSGACDSVGENFGCGTLFRITPSGALTTLHSFDLRDGQGPNGLVQATDGNLYGTTALGGVNACEYENGCGTLFKISLSGAFTTLHDFDSTDGGLPGGSLVQASDSDSLRNSESGRNVLLRRHGFQIRAPRRHANHGV